MTFQLLPDYGLFLLSQGVQPSARLVFFDVPIDHITRPALRTISVTQGRSAHSEQVSQAGTPSSRDVALPLAFLQSA